ncbi:MAG TPA: murein L,D-transpeptidase catalytic domain family protein [Prolixibacteraceae bacterium]|nr:murein L,D-transpeptidase catalytic domain family protein [Prolixibacteraceae bacterium]
MKKIIIYVLFLLIPAVNNAGITEFKSEKVVNNDLYTFVHLADSGLSRDVFNLAIKGLNKLDINGKLQNPNIVTIADYSQSSNKKRLYVIDLKNKKLLFNTYVAHGRNTGEEYARSFSNEEGSHKSSLGFYITEHSIVGSHTGFSLLINGVEKGFNDHAVERAIIMHAAEYATENFIKKYGRLGRSYGCPSVPPEMNKPIIDAIQGGTCLFLYNPNKDYISQSALLN